MKNGAYGSGRSDAKPRRPTSAQKKLLSWLIERNEPYARNVWLTLGQWRGAELTARACTRMGWIRMLPAPCGTFVPRSVALTEAGRKVLTEASAMEETRTKTPPDTTQSAATPRTNNR